jgi:cell division protein ZapE
MKLAGNASLEKENTDNLLMEYYQMSIDSGELEADHFQKQAVIALQQVYNTLLPSNANCHPFFKRIFSFITPQTIPRRKGLYLWGGVGRGKTLLVDYFFNLAPTDKKLRLHFHRFMLLVHEELNQLQHVSNPLAVIAKKLARRIDLLCLDEMHVNDITDAMLLSKLFHHLFAHGIVLVTTSNYPPSALYKNGLQRERFIPVITQLEQYTHIVQMGGNEDYRLKTLVKNTVYYSSNSKFSEGKLQHYFHQLVAIERHKDRTDIIIKQRSIPVKSWGDGVVWFDFNQICKTARSTEDYIQIANIFHTVLISNITAMDASMDDIARRFVNMIDEFYDLRVNLVVSAQVTPEKLYLGKNLTFEFKRTASRLYEMQSENYMASKHLS